MFRRGSCFSLFFFLFLSGIGNAADQRALLELRINEIKKGEVTVFLRGTDVLVKVADLQGAGVRAQIGRQELIRDESYVLLNSLAPQVSFKIDERDLSLNLTAQPSILGFTRFDGQANRPARMVYSEDSSGFVNYSVSLRDFKQVSAFTEVGISVKNGLLYSALSRNDDGSFVRGLTNLSISNRENLNRTVVGDRLVATDILGGSVVMGGVSFFREFGLDPYFVRNPGLNYSGAVATPSTVDVYVNGQFLRSVPLPPGEFELKDLPVPAGAANTRLVLRDAFGREQEIGSQYYFTSGLLKEGLHEFSYNLGVKRNNLATHSWDYGPPVFIARHRVGLTDSLTGAVRLEGSTSTVSGGPGVSYRLPIGEMELAASGSAGDGGPGGGAYFGYSYLGQSLNFGMSARALSPHYSTTSLSPSDKRSWLQLNSLIGFPITSGVGVTLRYIYENSQTDGLSHRISAAATARLTNQISVFINGGVGRLSNGFSTDVFTGLTFLLGETTGTVSYQRFEGSGNAALTLQKSLPLGSGFGYRFQTDTNIDGSHGPSVNSLVQYQGPYGRYETNYARLNGQNTSLLSMAGGMAVIGGDFFLTRPVQDSFAVIQVPGVGGVRGYSSNQEMGYSNKSGNLFVPNLLPYYGNKLGISDKDIPLNYTIDATEKIVAPPFRGGAVVTFAVQKVQRIVGAVTLENNGAVTIPAYGQLVVSTKDGKQFESPIGRRGEFYLENLPSGRYEALLEHKEQRCKLVLDVPNLDQPEIKLGTLSCQVQ